MRCNKCGTEAFINFSEIVVEGDESPETETKVFNVAHYLCRNKACSEYGCEVGTDKTQMYPRI